MSFLAAMKKCHLNLHSLDLKNLDKRAKTSFATLLKYILETQKISLSNINLLETYDIINYMSIDSSSRRNLELTENLRDKTKGNDLGFNRTLPLQWEEEL